MFVLNLIIIWYFKKIFLFLFQPDMDWTATKIQKIIKKKMMMTSPMTPGWFPIQFNKDRSHRCPQLQWPPLRFYRQNGRRLITFPHLVLEFLWIPWILVDLKRIKKNEKMTRRKIRRKNEGRERKTRLKWAHIQLYLQVHLYSNSFWETFSFFTVFKIISKN